MVRIVNAASSHIVRDTYFTICNSFNIQMEKFEFFGGTKQFELFVSRKIIWFCFWLCMFSTLFSISEECPLLNEPSSFCLQGTGILLTIILRALGPYTERYYDSDDDYSPGLVPLLRNYVPSPSYAVADPNHASKSDSWNIRI